MTTTRTISRDLVAHANRIAAIPSNIFSSAATADRGAIMRQAEARLYAMADQLSVTERVKFDEACYRAGFDALVRVGRDDESEQEYRAMTVQEIVRASQGTLDERLMRRLAAALNAV